MSSPQRSNQDWLAVPSSDEPSPAPYADSCPTRCIWITCANVLFFVAIGALNFHYLHRMDIENRSDTFFTSLSASQASQCGCPRLAIFPFDVACPANCSSHRMGLHNATFYKTSSAFVFGNLTSFREQLTPTEPFQGGARVAQSFLAVEKAIVESVRTRVQEANLPPLIVHRQSIMHMSLDYLCCLTEREMALAQELRARYVATHYVNFPVEFGEVQCFHERFDSITLIWIADAFLQSLLLDANYQLANVLRAKGVPVLVDRRLQMPFHSTLVGFRASGGQDISKYRKVVQAAIEASGSHSLKTYVDENIRLGSTELSRNLSETSYAMFGNAEDVKWYVKEECIG